MSIDPYDLIQTLATAFKYHLTPSGKVVECSRPLWCDKVHASTPEDLREPEPEPEPRKLIERVNAASKGEQELFHFIRSLDDVIVLNSRTVIPPQELDIYLPMRDLAIEFNGNYWHSRQMMREDPATYHQAKVDRCASYGVTLVFVWESDWKNKRTEVQNALRLFVREGFVDPILTSLTNPLEEADAS